VFALRYNNYSYRRYFAAHQDSGLIKVTVSPDLSELINVNEDHGSRILGHFLI